MSSLRAWANFLFWNAFARGTSLVSAEAAFRVAEARIRFVHTRAIRAAHMAHVVARGNTIFDGHASAICARIERAADSPFCAAFSNSSVDALSITTANGSILWARRVLTPLFAEHTAAVGTNHSVAGIVALLEKLDAFAGLGTGGQSLELAGRLDAEFGLWNALVDACHPSVVFASQRIGEAELS